MKLDPTALTVLKDFNEEFPPVEKMLPSMQQVMKPKNSKPMVLSRSPTVPPPTQASDNTLQKRQTLPIFSFREQILQSIDANRIVLIHGSTGSGKTTQIPQYILENAFENNLPCRILCTQPRRISTIASSDRVCFERAESAGGTIGYQIRLESSVSQDTNCIFLTPGVFLRYLMSGNPESLFRNITHILVDEAHERAKENDFLLTSIKEHFNANPNLKLVIMSATMDTGVFASYFGACEEISISTKQFDVEEIYLEDILKMIKFNNPAVEELNARFKSGKLIEASKSAYVNDSSEADEMPLDPDTEAYLNEILETMSTSGNPESEFQQFVYLVEAENVPIDFRHAATKMTTLMIAIGRGFVSTVEALLNLKADISLRVPWNGMEITCIDIAQQMHGPESHMVQLLEQYAQSAKAKVLTTSDLYNKALLNIYSNTINRTSANQFVVEEGIDHEMIYKLIEQIHCSADLKGAILVFLPGFDDIITQSNMIKDRLRSDNSLFLLHSSMKTEDQKNVFKPVREGVRKIILSTNIAESSITIDDVVSWMTASIGCLHDLITSAFFPTGLRDRQWPRKAKVL